MCGQYEGDFCHILLFVVMMLNLTDFPGLVYIEATTMSISKYFKKTSPPVPNLTRDIDERGPSR